MPLFLLFFVFPLIETWLLFKFSSEFGFFTTLILILITAILGSRQAKQQGFAVLNKIQTELKNGIPPNETLLEGLLILVSGIILFLPGLISDALGIALLIPQFRKILLKHLPKHLNKFQGKSFSSGFRFHTNVKQPPNSKTLNEAEYEVMDD